MGQGIRGEPQRQPRGSRQLHRVRFGWSLCQRPHLTLATPRAYGLRSALTEKRQCHMAEHSRLGGIIHTYQKFDPVHFPSPTAPPPDLVSPAFEHLLLYGDTRRLTDEELARAIRIDPSQIRGLGPSLEALAEILRERKRKILATYETDHVQAEAHDRFHDLAVQAEPPGKLAKRY